MTEIPHVDSFDPEGKDGIVSQSLSKNGAETNAAHEEEEASLKKPVELDIVDPHFMADAYDIYADLRAKGPVSRVRFTGIGEGEEASGDGTEERRDFFGRRETFFVSHYDEVIATLLDDRFSVDPRSGMSQAQLEQQPPMPEEFRPLSRSLLLLDPPDHTRLRKLVQPSFTGRGMEALRGSIQQIVDDLLEQAELDAAERGEAAPDRRMDLIEAFAYPFPVTVISDMLGIPREDRETIRGWTENLLSADRRRGQEMDEETRAGLREFIAYLKDLFERKRRAPTEDMISRLVHAEEDGDMLDEEEVLSTVFLLFLAGHVTTVNLVGNGVVALLTHPDQLAKLKANPELLARGVVEETLRYWGPVDFIGRRIAKEDVEVGGTVIPTGEQATVSLASANRDPERFANPDVFDITRADANRHLAFGKGIHVCLGAPLARVEGQVAFTTLFRRFPELRLAVPAEEVSWGGSFLRGFARLPVLF
jgi:cytochrome P450